MKNIELTKAELKMIPEEFLEGRSHRDVVKLVFGYTWIDIYETLPFGYEIRKRNGQYVITDKFLKEVHELPEVNLLMADTSDINRARKDVFKSLARINELKTWIKAHE